EAKSRLAVVVDQWAGTFADMRRRRDPSGAEVAVAVYDHYANKVEAGDKERMSRPTPDEIEAAFKRAAELARTPHPNGPDPVDTIHSMTEVEILLNKAGWAANRRSARLNRLRADLGTGDTRIIEGEADAFLSANGFQIPKGSSKYYEVCHLLMRAD